MPTIILSQFRQGISQFQAMSPESLIYPDSYKQTSQKPDIDKQFFQDLIKNLSKFQRKKTITILTRNVPKFWHEIDSICSNPNKESPNSEWGSDISLRVLTKNIQDFDKGSLPIQCFNLSMFRQWFFLDFLKDFRGLQVCKESSRRFHRDCRGISKRASEFWVIWGTFRELRGFPWKLHGDLKGVSTSVKTFR